VAIGPSILTSVNNVLYKIGTRRVTLATNQELYRAIKFYGKMGYKVEEIKVYTYTNEI